MAVKKERVIEEVFEAIEAFKKDMKKLGVLVEVSVHSAPVGVDHEVTEV